MLSFEVNLAVVFAPHPTKTLTHMEKESPPLQHKPSKNHNYINLFYCCCSYSFKNTFRYSTILYANNHRFFNVYGYSHYQTCNNHNNNNLYNIDKYHVHNLYNFYINNNLRERGRRKNNANAQITFADGVFIYFFNKILKLRSYVFIICKY